MEPSVFVAVAGNNANPNRAIIGVRWRSAETTNPTFESSESESIEVLRARAKAGNSRLYYVTVLGPRNFCTVLYNPTEILGIAALPYNLRRSHWHATVI